MKKILSAVLTAILIFSPAGTYVFHDEVSQAWAKSYRSGKGSFNSGIKGGNNNSYYQKKRSDSNITNRSNPARNNRGFTAGRFFRGMMVGGLAGLLFGSLLTNMGALGSFFGLIINVLAIVVLIAVIRGIFRMFTRRRREDDNQWRR